MAVEHVQWAARLQRLVLRHEALLVGREVDGDRRVALVTWHRTADDTLPTAWEGGDADATKGSDVAGSARRSSRRATHASPRPLGGRCPLRGELVAVATPTPRWPRLIGIGPSSNRDELPPRGGCRTTVDGVPVDRRGLAGRRTCQRGQSGDRALDMRGIVSRRSERAAHLGRPRDHAWSQAGRSDGVARVTSRVAALGRGAVGPQGHPAPRPRAPTPDPDERRRRGWMPLSPLPSSPPRGRRWT